MSYWSYWSYGVMQTVASSTWFVGRSGPRLASIPSRRNASRDERPARGNWAFQFPPTRRPAASGRSVSSSSRLARCNRTRWISDRMVRHEGVLAKRISSAVDGHLPHDIVDLDGPASLLVNEVQRPARTDPQWPRYPYCGA